MYGGLGNQLFIYSFACYLLDIRNEEIVIDVTDYLYNTKIDFFSTHTKKYESVERKLDIQKLCLDNRISFRQNNFLRFFKYPTILNYFLQRSKFTCFGKYIRTNSIKFHNRDYVTSLPRATYLDNHWFDWYYPSQTFSSIKKIFSTDIPLSDHQLKLKKSIEGTKHACFLHIRRGDYFNLKNWSFVTLGETYYIEAIKYLKNRLGDNFALFIFGDDELWLETYFIPLLKKHYLTKDISIYLCSKQDNSNIGDLFLMQLCQHGIIANSTFSWWGAFLISNSNKIIVSPKRFSYNPKTDYTESLIPTSWTKIDDLWSSMQYRQ